MEKSNYHSDTSSGDDKKAPFYLCISFWSLLLANVVVIVWALLKKWPIEILIWTYFFQNIILGLFWPAKVFSSTVDSDYTKKIKCVFVFMPQYFIMHFLFSVVLVQHFGEAFSNNYKSILLSSGIFFLFETISYIMAPKNKSASLSIVKIQLFPYARAIPIYLVMFFWLFAELKGVPDKAGVLFLSLKALLDVGVYTIERSVLLGKVVTANLNSQVKENFKMEHIFSKPNEKHCSFCNTNMKNKKDFYIKNSLVCFDCFNEINTEIDNAKE